MAFGSFLEIVLSLGSKFYASLPIWGVQLYHSSCTLGNVFFPLSFSLLVSLVLQLVGEHSLGTKQYYTPYIL